MKDSRFDAWTRRRIGLATGGVIAPLLGLSGSESTHGKKRCKKLGKPCRDGGRKCCKGRACCGPPPDTFCGKQGGEPCARNRDCCNLQCVGKKCALV